MSPAGDRAPSLGPFRLDRAGGILLRDGQPVPVGRRAFDTLAALLDANGETLSKDTLLATVWPGLVVEENNLQVQISALRKTLGDGWIVTVPGRGYRLTAAPQPIAPAQPDVPPPLPDRPSLVVLPFANHSDDPAQEYFADGMVDDITTALSRVGGLFVIARNSAFTYKGRPIDPRQVGRDLGVRYLIEGSVRKAADRVRITCQLVDAATATHLWAGRFEGTLEHIFDLQDQVTEAVAAAIEPTLRDAEIRRALAKPTSSTSAYDLYLRALAAFDRLTAESVTEAWRLLNDAIAADPNFVLARALAATCGSVMAHQFNLHTRGTPEAELALDHARRALAKAGDDPLAISYAARGYTYLSRDIGTGRAAMDRARAINPKSPLVLTIGGWIKLWDLDWSAAFEDLSKAKRLSPLDPNMRIIDFGLGLAMCKTGALEEGIALIRRSIATTVGITVGRPDLILVLVDAGRLDDAREVARAHLAIRPETLRDVRRRAAPYRSEYIECLIAAMRLAGIPE